MVRNSIIYFNEAPVGANYYVHNLGTNLFYTCTTPIDEENGNRDRDPHFKNNGAGSGTNYLGGDLHLRSRSPCRNAGAYRDWMTGAWTLEGQPRINEGHVDMGGYEYFERGVVIDIH